MASYIAIPRDLSKVKTKVLFGLTKRQLICFGSGALVGVPIFFLLRFLGLDISSAVMGMMIVMIPFFLLAMYEKNGQPLEKYLKMIIQAKLIRSKIRPYKTNNYYTCLLRQAAAEREVNRIVSEGHIRKKKPNTQTSAGFNAKGTKTGSGSDPKGGKQIKGTKNCAGIHTVHPNV